MHILSRLLWVVLMGNCCSVLAADGPQLEFVVKDGYVAQPGGGCPKYARVMGPDGYCWPAVRVMWIDGRIADIKVPLKEVCSYEKTAPLSIAPTVFVCGIRNSVCRRCS